MSNCCTPNGSCHTPATTDTGTTPATATVTKAVYRANGIGSAHCQGVVTDAVRALDGVTAVAVEIGTGLITVTTGVEADEAFDARIGEAVGAAGYDFAGRVPA
ncbi:heavy-metal-associated domain-containing protein [Streptomyces sp. G45]|uniref:heavy-metal-associated domain-containing protein n=1 Tax=Streptomyces sp. G45 TaxID=3406627 RepID=UPI003C16841B